MNPMLREFLTGLIDYAGLFPPAALDMSAAVRNYAAYRKGEHASWLGRFILPVSRLDEFERAAIGLPENGGPWPLSALAGADIESDRIKIAVFNDAVSSKRNAVIDIVEIKAERASEIERATKLLSRSFTIYVEIPIANDPLQLAELIKAISGAGARAKVRTGGVTADAFPSSCHLARFLAACAEEDVPFKATAGLHHPIRSINKLTYEPGSASAMMHGFLNVFIAAAFAQNGMCMEELAEVLDETSPDAFQFDSGGVRWRGEMAMRAHLRNTRNLFAISFGSCSFTEPVEDLQRLHLI